MNFDETFFAETKSAGVGVVVCDCDGQIIGLVQSVEMVEALAARRAVRLL